jgi:hypothetical protein
MKKTLSRYSLTLNYLRFYAPKIQKIAPKIWRDNQIAPYNKEKWRNLVNRATLLGKSDDAND